MNWIKWCCFHVRFSLGVAWPLVKSGWPYRWHYNKRILSFLVLKTVYVQRQACPAIKISTLCKIVEIFLLKKWPLCLYCYSLKLVGYHLYTEWFIHQMSFGQVSGDSWRSCRSIIPVTWGRGDGGTGEGSPGERRGTPGEVRELTEGKMRDRRRASLENRFIRSFLFLNKNAQHKQLGISLF